MFQSTMTCLYCFPHLVHLQNKSFYRVKGKVQLGTYRLRSRGLEVSQLFLDDVDALPIEYEKGQYFGFMEDYGTHYTKNGRAGGEYELIYVLNKNTKKDKCKYTSFHVITADDQSLNIYNYELLNSSLFFSILNIFLKV